MEALHVPSVRRFALALAASIAALMAAQAAGASASKSAGSVYTLTNASGGNAVAIFDYASDGTLTPAGSVPTGGLGTGSGLGSQNALVLSKNGKDLYAVNAGDDSISTFKVKSNSLQAVGSPVPSGGVRPISLTIRDKLLYVLNAGNGGGSAGNITGFEIKHGQLQPIPGSTRPLSGASVGPAEVQFSPNGKLLVVTEKGTNLIDTYVVGKDGVATGPNSQASAATTPFGFTFSMENNLIVSDAVGGGAGASGLSSYDVSSAGTLNTITAFSGNTQTAACWVVATKNGRFAYTTNTGSATISAYTIDHDGALSLLNAVGASTRAAPIDAALNKNEKYLYALVSGAIDAFRVGNDGSLTPITGATGLPAGAVGLAAG